MKIISIANQKGGVGKTTTTMNLAAGLVKKGFQVLTIDLDPQANLSEYLGYEPNSQPTIYDLMLGITQNQIIDPALAICESAEGIEYIPSNISLAGMESTLASVMFRERILLNILSNDLFKKYDYIIIDCSPTLGVLLTNALSASHSVLIPVQAHKFAVDGLGQLTAVIEMVKNNINNALSIDGIILTMADNTNMTKAIKEALQEAYGNLLFDTNISRSVSATNSTADQVSLVSYKNKLGQEYMNLVQELIERGV